MVQVTMAAPPAAAARRRRHHHRRARWRRAERNEYAVKEAHVREESLEISQSATEAINSGMDEM